MDSVVNTLEELVLDSSSFLSQYDPFTYVIKEIPEDFQVFEIAETMEEAGDCDTIIPDKPVPVKRIQQTSEIQIDQTATPIEYCEYTDEMRHQVNEFCERALIYGFKDQYMLNLPTNQKIRPEVLQAIGTEFPHIALQSRAGSLQFSRHPNMDPLSEIVGADIAPSILSFITTSKMDKEGTSPHTFTLPAMGDKEKRRACHLFFRQKYPYVKTSTSGQDNCIILTIYPNRKRSRKNQKRNDNPERADMELESGLEKESDRKNGSKTEEKNCSIQENEKEEMEIPEAKRIHHSSSSSILPLQFVLKKTNFELMSLRIRLSQLLHISQRSIGFAGIKDKKAITYQFATMIGVEPECLLAAVKELPGIEVSGLKWVEKPLEIGQLWGNRFHLKIRHCSCDPSCFEKAMQLVAENGFVNYYGTQRFGSDGAFEVANATVGLLLMRGDWGQCLQYLLTPSKDTCSISALEHFQEHADCRAAIRLLPASSHTLLSILRALRQYGCENTLQGIANGRGISDIEKGRLLEVIKSIPLEIGQFYVKAFQSYLFNKVTQWRIQHYGKEVLEGDSILNSDDDDYDNNKDIQKDRMKAKKEEEKDKGIENEHEMTKPNEIRLISQEEKEKVKLDQVVMPLCGWDVKVPANAIGEYYNQLLLRYIGKEMNELTKEMPFVLPGSYRPIAAKVYHLEYHHLDDQTVEIDFKLRRGVYATTMLREISGNH